MVIAGNSSRCIKTVAAEGDNHYHSLPAPTLGRFLPSHTKRSLLSSLEIAAVCNAGRILMHMAAYIGMVSEDTYSWILGKKISGPVSRKETKGYKG